VAIHARLGTVEGRVTLIARNNREELLESLEEQLRAKPLIAQIYLALDGERNQTKVFKLLDKAGISTSQMAVSRNLKKMNTELGIVELASASGGNIYRKGDESEKVLDLSANARKWLKSLGKTDPAPPPGRKRRKLQ
jgi:hypothetical protein